MRSFPGKISEAPAAATRPWPALALLGAAQFLTVLNFQVATVALPSIGSQLVLSPQGLQWDISAHALADIAGHRRLFLLGLGLFAGATLACGLAPAGTHWRSAARRARRPGYRHRTLYPSCAGAPD